MCEIHFHQSRHRDSHDLSASNPCLHERKNEKVKKYCKILHVLGVGKGEAEKQKRKLLSKKDADKKIVVLTLKA